MKIAILHTVSGLSADRLSKSLEQKGHEVRVVKVMEDDYRGSGEDLVIRLGSSVKFNAKNLLNTRVGVKTCVNKFVTLCLLHSNKIPTVNFTADSSQTEGWETAVCHLEGFGHNGKGIVYSYQGEKRPDANLYTEWYNHRQEYRVIYALGRAFVYRKVRDEYDGWMLKKSDNQETFRKMKETCSKAAKVLGMDIVGFDVLSKTKKEFVICEANSGTWLPEEVCDYIAQKVK